MTSESANLVWIAMGRACRLCLALALVGAASWASPAAAAGRDHALLIGINDYQRVPDLRGAVNDVVGMRLLLTTRLGFRPEDVHVLTDGEATRERILAALEDLVARVGPEDSFYLHYSGHGSQVRDVSGDEDDGKDETLIPHDGRSPGVADITDDEIDDAVSRLRARRGVIVLDSCHSGTATRGGVTVQQRSVPPDERTSLYARTAPVTRAIVPLPQERYVVFTGAASHEKALDAPIDGSSYGLFSYALERSLASHGPEASPVTVMNGVASEIERVKAQLALIDVPEPQLEAPPGLLDAPLLPRAAASPLESGAAQAEPARVPWVSAGPGPTKGTALLLGAARVGARAGSLFAIYPPGERRFAPGIALAQAVVTEIRGDDALARLDPAEREVAPGSRAVVSAAPPPPASVAVRWASIPAGRRGPLEAAIRQRVPSVAFVGEREFARFVIQIEDGRCVVFGADGQTRVGSFESSDDDALAARLSSLFERSSTTTELLALDNPLSELRLQLRARAATTSEIATGASSLVVGPTEAPRYRIRRPGEPRGSHNSLQLFIEASASCYLTLVDVDSQGNVLVLFPNPISDRKGFHPDGLIPGGEVVSIPDSLAVANRAGFYLDYSPPGGSDTVRGFCSLDQETAGAIRDYVKRIAATADRKTREAPARRRARATLAEQMRLDLAKRASRGFRDVSPSGASVEPSQSDWVAASLTLHIEE